MEENSDSNKEAVLLFIDAVAEYIKTSAYQINKIWTFILLILFAMILQSFFYSCRLDAMEKKFDSKIEAVQTKTVVKE